MFKVGMIVRTDNSPKAGGHYSKYQKDVRLYYNPEMDRYKGRDLVITAIRGDKPKAELDFVNEADREEVDGLVEPGETIDTWVWLFDWLVPVVESVCEVDAGGIEDLL